MRAFGKVVTTFVRSRTFFVATIILFVVEAGWIALSARYPMAFDEGYHLGLIQLFAKQWSPLMLHQPAGPAPLGAVVHNSSFLYHWLMSFPYRILQPHFSMQTTIIVLRFINIVFFAGSLVLFRRLLAKTRASLGAVQVALFFFVLVPVVPLLAGQINYDNLLMLLLPFNLLLAWRFYEQLQQKRLSVGLLCGTFCLALLSSLVVFVYLPVLTAIVFYLLYGLGKYGRLRPGKLWLDVRLSWRRTANWQKVILTILFIVSTGLFVGIYGTNLVQYHNLTPQCGQVLGANRCLSYGPWVRNYQYSLQAKPANFSHNPAVFLGGWLQGMFLRSFFAINGPGGPEPYQNKPPLLLVSVGAVAVFDLGVYLLIRYWRAIVRHDPALQFLLFVSLVYTISLLGKNYVDYLRFGRLVAINGRYLLLAILPLMAVMGSAYGRFLRTRWRGTVGLVILLLFLQGGGALTFIFDSNPGWYWPNDRLVVRSNSDVQAIVRYFILSKPRPKFW